MNTPQQGLLKDIPVPEGLLAGIIHMQEDRKEPAELVISTAIVLVAEVRGISVDDIRRAVHDYELQEPHRVHGLFLFRGRPTNDGRCLVVECRLEDDRLHVVHVDWLPERSE